MHNLNGVKAARRGVNYPKNSWAPGLKKAMKNKGLEKQNYHHGNLREALLAAAMETLTTEGADALSLRKVAKQAGVSAPALYSHFSDKRELLAHLAAKGYQLFSASMRKELPDQKTSGKQYLIGLARGYVYFAVEHPALFQLMFSAELGDLSTIPELANASFDSYSLLEDSVRKQVAATGSAVSAEIAIAASWSIVHGLASLLNERRISISESGANSLDDLVNQVGSMLTFTGTD